MRDTYSVKDLEEDDSEPTAEKSSENSFYLPHDIANASDFKPGDTITFTVIGADKDGDIEVELNDENAPQKTDLTQQ